MERGKEQKTQGVAVRDGARAMGVWLIAAAALIGLGKAWPAMGGGLAALGIGLAIWMIFRGGRATNRLVVWEAAGRLHLRGLWLTRIIDCGELAAVGFYYRGHEPVGVRVSLRSGGAIDCACLGPWAGVEERVAFADAVEAFCLDRGWRFDAGSGRWRP